MTDIYKYVGRRVCVDTLINEFSGIHVGLFNSKKNDDGKLEGELLYICNSHDQNAKLLNMEISRRDNKRCLWFDI